MLVYFSTAILSVTLFTSIFHFIGECYLGLCENLHFDRWIFSISISLLVAAWGLKRRSLDWSGAVVGTFVGLVLTLSSYCFLACLLTFFYTSSKATHFCSEKKKKLEANYKQGGQRNWIQVVSNGGAATEIALLYVLYGGVGESIVEFDKNYERSWLAAAVLSALAGANGDTWASELGTVMSKEEPRLITSFQKVPIGTNGGFTLVGLFHSALGGSVVGLAYFVALSLSTSCRYLLSVEQAFLLIFMGAFAGLFGSIIDSAIGATLQYSGLDMRTGKIVDNPGVGVKHISGKPLLNNHSVNMVMTIISSIIVPTVTARLCLFFR